MKTIFLVITASTLFFCQCVKRNNDNDLATFNLKGKVSYVQQSLFEADERFGEVQTGELILKDEYEFNKKGRLIKQLVYFDGDLYEMWISKLDEDGKLVRENIYGADGRLQNYTTIKHDSDGNVIERKMFDNNNDLESRMCYKFDPNGRRIEMAVFNKAEILEETRKWEYDKKGNLILFRLYNGDNRLSYQTHYDYDRSGDWIKKNVVEGEAKSGKELIYKTEFDKQGNWIKKIAYENDRPTEVETRLIKYH